MMIAKSGQFVVTVEFDNDPLDPREQYDNFGHMVCWHRRYSLGDKHGYDSPEKFLSELVHDNTGNAERKKIIADVKRGEYDGMKLEYNRSSREWELNVYCDFLKKWFTEYTFDAPLENNLDLVFDAIVENMSMDALVSITGDVAVILPLYLYDHSGITMNTTGFSCRWDSGQVGWIYATKDEIRKEYGKLTEDTIDAARRLLVAEVSEYDSYISGQCYGFRLYEDGKEIDSCWGFLGDFREVIQWMKQYMPEGHEDMLDSLEELECGESIEDYLEVS
jgi:hypothetical protein